MPLISVIVPVYKVEQYLHRCVDSILTQTFTDFELILVDDGSPDSCGVICEEYAEKDKRVHVIHQENGGLSAARNTGIDWAFANSDSKWLSFIDSDDWVHEQYLELLYSAVDQFQTAISQCRFQKTSGTVPENDPVGNMLCVSPKEQYINWYGAYACGKLYDKRCFETLRYPVGILYEDIAIWYKLLFSVPKIAIVDEALYYYYQRDDSIMNTAWHPKMLARLDAWDTQVAFFDQLGDERLLQEAIERYGQVAKHEYYAIIRSTRLTKQEKADNCHNVEQRIRRLMTKYQRYVKNSTQYPWCFEVVHPFLSGCAYKVKKSIRAIKHHQQR